MIEKNRYMYILKGYLFALLISIIILFIYALLLVNTAIQENTIKPTIIVITGISTLIGSFISSNKIKKQGIFNGISVSVLYIFSLYVLSSIAITGFSINLNCIIMFLVGIILGCFGGILGVNLNK